MANSVLLTLEKLGYKRSDSDTNTFIKKQKMSHLTVIFHKEEKYLSAVQTPVRSILERKDIIILYGEWVDLVKDMKTLSNLTGYSIINNIEEDE